MIVSDLSCVWPNEPISAAVSQPANSQALVTEDGCYQSCGWRFGGLFGQAIDGLRRLPNGFAQEVDGHIIRFGEALGENLSGRLHRGRRSLIGVRRHRYAVTDDERI